MKNKIQTLLVLMLFFISSNAQSPKDYTIQISTEIVNSPLGIKLKWPLDVNATSYNIFRKQINSNVWSVLASNLPGNTTNYTDENIISGFPPSIDKNCGKLVFLRKDFFVASTLIASNILVFPFPFSPRMQFILGEKVMISGFKFLKFVTCNLEILYVLIV